MALLHPGQPEELAGFHFHAGMGTRRDFRQWQWLPSRPRCSPMSTHAERIDSKREHSRTGNLSAGSPTEEPLHRPTSYAECYVDTEPVVPRQVHCRLRPVRGRQPGCGETIPLQLRVDLRKHRQQSSNLGAWPDLVLSAWRARAGLVVISCPLAQPSVTAFATSWPGENAEWTQPPRTVGASAIERPGVNRAMWRRLDCPEKRLIHLLFARPLLVETECAPRPVPAKQVIWKRVAERKESEIS